MKTKISKIGAFLKNKKAVVGAGAVALANSAFAAPVSFDETTKKFTGEIDLTPFYSGVVIVVGCLGAVFAVKMVIGLFRK